MIKKYKSMMFIDFITFNTPPSLSLSRGKVHSYNRGRAEPNQGCPTITPDM